ncbi:MAG: hypothetical protein KF766_16165, partial [Rhodocyclaceae bacterium]|nr:hypothetical protein [Rhodocyclaceae bacterium]
MNENVEPCHWAILKGAPTAICEGAYSFQTPGERLERAYQKQREDLSSELLKTIEECSPAFFERLVIDVRVKMGDGGSRKEAGRAIGRSGDEGVAHPFSLFAAWTRRGNRLDHPARVRRYALPLPDP